MKLFCKIALLLIATATSLYSQTAIDSLEARIPLVSGIEKVELLNSLALNLIVLSCG